MADKPSDHLRDVYTIATEAEHFWAYYWVVQGVRPLLALCQSPVEEMLAIALWSKAPRRGPDATNGVRAQVEVGPYRADFVIHYTSHTAGTKADLVVEVDGHDFHEKTKEQASRDKARDRFFLGEGFQVARFTGSDVYRDPFGCAEEAWNLVVRLAEPS